MLLVEVPFVLYQAIAGFGRTQERGCERLFYGIGVDTRRSKGERRRRTWRRTAEKERNMAGWKSWNVAKAAGGNRECWADNVMALCAYWGNET